MNVFARPIASYRNVEPETLTYLFLKGGGLTAAQIAAVDANIKAIKYGSGITLSSQTANLSLVNGTAFISNPLVDLRPYVGFKVTLTNGANSAVGWIQQAGTGEQLSGIEKLLNPNFDTDTANWAANKANVSLSVDASGQSGNCLKVSQAAAAYGAADQIINTTIGSLIKVTGYVKQGTTPLWAVQVVRNSTPFTTLKNNSGTATSLWANLTPTYFVAISDTTTKFEVYCNSDSYNRDIYFDTLSAQQVLTPSATGVTIVNTKGGSVQNWVSNTLTGNEASYTVTITLN